MRDIMLKRPATDPIDEYVDKNVGYDLWAKFLFCFGTDCTNPVSVKRPRMGSVNDALESLIKGQPQAMALQVSFVFCYTIQFGEGYLAQYFRFVNKYRLIYFCLKLR